MSYAKINHSRFGEVALALQFDADHIGAAITRMFVEVEVYPGDDTSTLIKAFDETMVGINDCKVQAAYLRRLADILDPPTVNNELGNLAEQVIARPTEKGYRSVLTWRTAGRDLVIKAEINNRDWSTAEAAIVEGEALMTTLTNDKGWYERIEAWSSLLL